MGLTIASRAAIEGGVHFEIALSLTDTYFQELSHAKSTEEVSTIVLQCNEHLARLVSERRAEDNKTSDQGSSY